MSKINRSYKASVFTHIFGEPDKELELYNALSEVQYPPDTPVEDVTLEDAIYMDRINDLSFVIANKLIRLIEHQSSINPNIATRQFVYSGRVYEKVINKILKANNWSMYGKRFIICSNSRMLCIIQWN